MATNTQNPAPASDGAPAPAPAATSQGTAPAPAAPAATSQNTNTDAAQNTSTGTGQTTTTDQTQPTTNTQPTTQAQTTSTTHTSHTSHTTTHQTTNTKTALQATTRPHRPTEVNNPNKNPTVEDSGSGFSWGWLFLLVLVFAAVGAGVWWLYRRNKARRLGLAPPSLNPFGGGPGQRTGGVVGWVKEKAASVGRGRTARGAFEGDGSGATAYRGGGGARGLDPDEAWDSRVEHEADVYEASSYYGAEDASHRSRPTTLGEDGVEELELMERSGRGRYDGRGNPFTDAAEGSNMSVRDVSPRPVTDYDLHEQPRYSGDSLGERRSAFRENV